MTTKTVSNRQKSSLPPLNATDLVNKKYVDDSMLNAGDAPVSKIVPYSTGGQGQTVITSITASAQYGLRLPVRFSESPIEWRFRLRNFSMITLTAGLPNFTLNGSLFGREAAGGNFLGGTAATLTGGGIAIPSTGVAGVGDFYTSPWFSGAGQIPEAGVNYLLGLGITQPSAAAPVPAAWRAYSFTGTNASANGLNPATNSPTLMAGIPIDVVIEARYSTHAKSVLIVGDSIYEGATGAPGTGNTATSSFPSDSPPRRWARNNNLLVGNMSFGGIAARNMNDSATFPDFWTRFDFASAKYDFVIIGLGANDLVSDTLATYRENIMGVMDKIRAACGAGIPIYLSNVIPRTAANNTTRRSYNSWLATLPYGAVGLIDQNAVMGVAGDTGAFGAGLGTDNIHPSIDGQEVMAGQLGLTMAPLVSPGAELDTRLLPRRVTQVQFDALGSGRDPEGIYVIKG